MFYGYTEIDTMVLFTLDGNDIRVYTAIVRKFVNHDLTRILGNIFSEIESLRWNSLDQATVDAPSPGLFQK